MKLHYYLVSGLVLAVLLFTSCIREENIVPDNGKIVNVKVGLTIKTSDIVLSRTVTGTGAENAITQFHAFIFDRNTGMRIAHGASTGTTPKLFVDVIIGTYRICVVGNSQELPPGNYDAFWNAVTNYSSLQALTLAAGSHLAVGGTTGGPFEVGSPNMVMYGEDIVTLVEAPVGTPQAITIDVERIASKMIFNISNNITTAGESFLITKVSLVNTLANAGLTADLSGASYNNATSANIVLYNNPTGMNPTTGSPWTYGKDLYIFANMAGTVAAAGSEQRLKGTGGAALESSSKSPAYLLIEGVYSYIGGTQADVTQRVYLGHDNHSDFNVMHNEQHTYNISITKADETDTRVTVVNISRLEFTTAPVLQDAHYVMYPVKFRNPDGGTWNWTLSVSSGDDTWVTLKKTADLTELQTKGYWTEYIKPASGGSNIPAIGNGTISGSASGTAEQTVYLFMRENLSAERTVTLTLTEPGVGSTTLDVSQLSVAWNGTLGIEKLEEYNFPGYPNGYPWGFKWTKRVVFQTWAWAFPIAWYYAVVAQAVYGAVNNNSNAPLQFNNYILWARISIDYSKLNTTSGSQSTSDGLSNTKSLFGGGNSVVGTENLIAVERWGDSRLGLDKSVDAGGSENTEYFAARMCVLKNKFYEEEVASEGSEGVSYIPLIDNADFRWYLPARDQFNNMNQTAPYALSGNYWSSTANTSPNAYYRNASGAIASADRNTIYRIRCARNL